MKLFKNKFFIAFFSFLAIVLLAGFLFYSFYLKDLRVTPILMYHSVSQEGEGSLYVYPENFKKQMSYLNRKGYRVITLKELLSEINNGNQFIPKTVAITFDDGFEDNYLNAFPILEKYDIPATIFVVSGYVGVAEDYLQWDQIKLMQRNGIEIGAHTKSNVYLPSIESSKRLWEEVNGSGVEIEKETGVFPRFFCYPTGGFNPRVKLAVKKSGYEAAFTTNRGESRTNEDIFELKRVKVTNSDAVKPFHFCGKLSGFYNAFRSIKKGD